jgi:hypothetical protein
MGKKLIKFFFENIVGSEKLHRIKVNKSQNNFGKYFLWGKKQFF